MISLRSKAAKWIFAVWLFLLVYEFVVWPTPWHEWTDQNGIGNRVNRFTGERQETDSMWDSWWSEPK